MMTSNNSSLLKDSQELTKTKETIWKPLIAVSLLFVFNLTAGQYLPYIIAAVSGSGAIAAVPLAIFAVSVVVALVLATYLIKFVVSDNKKEAGPDGKESGHTASQEPQKFVCESCTNLESKPIGKECDKSVKQDSETQTEVRGSEHVDTITSQQPPLTLGTAIPQNNNAPPPPPLPPVGWENRNPPKNNTTGEKSPIGTTQDDKLVPINLGDILQAKGKLREPGAKGGQKPDGGDSGLIDVKSILSRRVAMEFSDDEDERESGVDDGEWNDNEEGTKTPDSDNVPDNEDLNAGQNVQDPQSFHRERSGSLDSGHGSDDNVKSKSTPPPPPPSPSSNGTSSSKDASSLSDSNVKPDMSAVFSNIRQEKPKLISKEERDKKLKEQAAKKSSNKGGGQQKNEGFIDDLEKTFQKRIERVCDEMSNVSLSPSHSSSVSSNGSEESEQDWSDDEDKHQLDNKKRRDSFDSGIGSRSTSTLENPPVPPSSRADSPSAAQVNNVDPVNGEVQDPSALPFKDRMALFGGEALRYQKESAAQRS